ncbi:MAG: tRNA pseudouridine(38-40) synthase TruA [Candidatus Hadarchaeales archaeon]
MGAKKGMRIALRIAYEGSSWFGFARQPGKRTVEGVLLQALSKAGLMETPEGAGYEAAARTDRGVSAIGQVVALTSRYLPTPEELNSFLPPDLTILSVKEVPPTFRPRREALFRHYRYVLPLPHPFDLHEARRGAKFLETTHTFAPFCKPEPGRPLSSKLFLVGIRAEGGILKADFIATNFLYHQVRRMMGALLLVGKGERKVEDLWKLSREGGRGWEPAPCEGLFLMKVGYKDLLLPPNPSAVKRFEDYLSQVPSLGNAEMRRILREELGFK